MGGVWRQKRGKVNRQRPVAGLSGVVGVQDGPRAGISHHPLKYIGGGELARRGVRNKGTWEQAEVSREAEAKAVMASEVTWSRHLSRATLSQPCEVVGLRRVELLGFVVLWGWGLRIEVLQKTNMAHPPLFWWNREKTVVIL